MAQVSERTIVITGSSDGVGAAAARRLAAAGDNVVVIAQVRGGMQGLEIYASTTEVMAAEFVNVFVNETWRNRRDLANDVLRVRLPVRSEQRRASRS
jgi:NAD(P)-dependent dehydrogenase (short-subunit alcohol dehydrogenase family)